MTDQDQPVPLDENNGESVTSADTRRGLLRLGALGAVAVVTIRPAIAQAATSVMNCTISVPDSARAGSAIGPDGSVVRPGSPGSFAGSPRPLAATDVKAALAGGQFPGTDRAKSQAWTNYIRRLQHGQSGFTCYASLQMPGRH